MHAANVAWPKNIGEARFMQERDKERLRFRPLKTEPELIAGVDAAFSEDTVYAAACLYRFRDLSLIQQTSAVLKADFPYVPGYLLFREGPAIFSALKKLKRTPDIILVDGQGIAHPRGIGSASHIGLLLEVPTIGCAKTRLVGSFREPGKKKGCWSELRYQERTVGAVVRTKDGVRCLFISPGHKIDLNGSISVTLASVRKFRIPEPLRCADMLSRKLKAELHTRKRRLSQSTQRTQRF